MICVSIGRSRHRHVIAEHKHLVEQGATLVELRLDYIRGEVQLKRLLAGRPCPVVATCRRDSDGGKYNGPEESRQAILRMAIAEGAEYIDLEEDIAANIPRFGATKRIVSLHNFNETPKDLSSIHQRLCELDADIVKIATMANSPMDNARMMSVIRESSVPTVGICMGDMGTPSRVLAGRFGAPFTYATFHQERPLAPGQISFQEMRDIYQYDDINENTAVFAVIADPVGHSLSPLIHNAALRHAGINAVYLSFRVPREYLDQFLLEAPRMGIRGLSVTIPHKETVVPYLGKTDRVVDDIGAANTLVFSDEGIVGFNTDSRAAIDSLESNLKVNVGDPLRNRTALVLGAGGAAKAVAYGLRRRGADVFITGRTLSRAKALAASLGCNVVDWKSRTSVDCQILVNCTPVGMHPHVDDTPFEKHYLKPSMTIFDTVYNPENTLLIKEARSQGCHVVTGVEMFVQQAALQFKLFTDLDVPVEVMRQTLKRATGAAKF
ncbi:MAG: shikimate dehydrogenase [Pirellulales bacterium]